MAARKQTTRSQPARSRPMNEGAKRVAQQLTNDQVESKLREYNAIIEKWQHNLGRVLEGRISVDRFARVVQTSITNTPKLLLCETSSLLGAILDCATIGLEPGGLLQHCWLIPTEEQLDGGGSEFRAQVMIGYRGFELLATRSNPDIYAFGGGVVFNRDGLIHRGGLVPKLEVEPCGLLDPGGLRAAYAVARMRGVPPELHPFEVVYEDDIKRACHPRKRGKPFAERSPAWRHHEPEMWRKTATRRLCKHLPSAGSDLAAAVSIDESHEVGIASNRWRSAVEATAPQGRSSFPAAPALPADTGGVTVPPATEQRAQPERERQPEPARRPANRAQPSKREASRGEGEPAQSRRPPEPPPAQHRHPEPEAPSGPPAHRHRTGSLV